MSMLWSGMPHSCDASTSVEVLWASSATSPRGHAQAPSQMQIEEGEVFDHTHQGKSASEMAVLQ